MKRVTNTYKSITSQTTSDNPSVPSMGGEAKVTVHFTKMPSLTNFVKGTNWLSSMGFVDRKVGIYKLIIKESGANLSYKLGKTKYTLSSYHLNTINKAQIKGREGYIVICKGIFSSKTFQVNELPKNIANSIEKNINQFNTEYGNKLDLINDIEFKAQQNKKNKFFDGLDT